METLDRTRSPVRRQVEAYEEAWKKDHDALEVCWALEDTISIGLATFAVLMRAENNWRDRVFRGGEPFSEDSNSFFVRLHELWLFVTEHVLALAADVEKLHVPVEGADQLRTQAEQAKQHLTTWTQSKLSAAMGLREMPVPKEAADELNRILTEARSSRRNQPHRPCPTLSNMSPSWQTSVRWSRTSIAELNRTRWSLPIGFATTASRPSSAEPGSGCTSPRRETWLASVPWENPAGGCAL